MNLSYYGLIISIALIVISNSLLLKKKKYGLDGTEKVMFMLPVFCYGSFKNTVANIHWFKILVTENQSTYSFFDKINYLTDLDPHANIIYRYAALQLLVQHKSPLLALRILKKSLFSSFNQDDWRIYFYIEYIYKFFLYDISGALLYRRKIAQWCKNTSHYLKKNRPEIPEHLLTWAC